MQTILVEVEKNNQLTTNVQKTNYNLLNRTIDNENCLLNYLYFLLDNAHP